MSVKKKKDSVIEKFIDKGSDVKSTKYSSFRNILIRVPTSLLNEIEGKIFEKPWTNRTNWIVEAIHEKLIKEN